MLFRSRLIILQRDDPQNFTDRRVRDFVINFLLAGRDTTASLLTFASYRVSQNPEVEKKMVEEMNRVIGEDKEFIPTWKNQKDLRYLKMVLRRLFVSSPRYLPTATRHRRTTLLLETSS